MRKNWSKPEICKLTMKDTYHSDRKTGVQDAEWINPDNNDVWYSES